MTHMGLTSFQVSTGISTTYPQTAVDKLWTIVDWSVALAMFERTGLGLVLDGLPPLAPLPDLPDTPGNKGNARHGDDPRATGQDPRSQQCAHEDEYGDCRPLGDLRHQHQPDYEPDHEASTQTGSPKALLSTRSRLSATTGIALS